VTVGLFRRGKLLVALLWTASIVASDASAQCTARAVLQNQSTPKETALAASQPIPVKSASIQVWKTITIGTFKDWFALINALDAAGCFIGDSAEEILARPAFTVSAAKTNVELFAVSPADLGFQGDTVSLARIYARAQQLGFGLAAAEIAAQLRLQYLDQPMGELLIGMEPIRTWSGEPFILSVANGGAGLVLIGQDGSPGAEIPVTSRFLFVRSNEAALASAGR
jgi:hypothetical protein